MSSPRRSVGCPNPLPVIRRHQRREAEAIMHVARKWDVILTGEAPREYRGQRFTLYATVCKLCLRELIDGRLASCEDGPHLCLDVFNQHSKMIIIHPKLISRVVVQGHCFKGHGDTERHFLSYVTGDADSELLTELVRLMAISGIFESSLMRHRATATIRHLPLDVFNQSAKGIRDNCMASFMERKSLRGVAEFGEKAVECTLYARHLGF